MHRLWYMSDCGGESNHNLSSFFIHLHPSPLISSIFHPGYPRNGTAPIHRRDTPWAAPAAAPGCMGCVKGEEGERGLGWEGVVQKRKVKGTSRSRERTHFYGGIDVSIFGLMVIVLNSYIWLFSC